MTQNVVEFPDRSVEEEAAEWLILLDREEPPSAAELASLREWLQRSAQHRDELARLAELWDRMNVLTELAVPLGRHEPESRSVRTRLPLAGAWAAAASVIVLLGATVFQNLAPVSPTGESLANGNGRYEAQIGKQKNLTLVDGSSVLLNTDSVVEVSYSDEFRDIRLIRGEAHFAVAPNPEQPFRVFAGTGRVMAVGTAFSVYLRDETVDVTVTEGRVELAALDTNEIDFSSDQAGSVELSYSRTPELVSAGQRVTLQAVAAETGNVARFGEIEDVDATVLQKQLSWHDGALMFSGETLGEVINEISRYTTVSIEFADPDIRSITIGGRYPIGQSDVLWETLESVYGLQLTWDGPDSVLLSRVEN